MDDTSSLFADILVNKSKLKPSSLQTQTAATPKGLVLKDNLNDALLHGVNQIFAEALSNNLLQDIHHTDFLAFLKSELPGILLKYNKYSQGKDE